MTLTYLTFDFFKALVVCLFMLGSLRVGAVDGIDDEVLVDALWSSPEAVPVDEELRFLRLAETGIIGDKGGSSPVRMGVLLGLCSGWL